MTTNTKTKNISETFQNIPQYSRYIQVMPVYLMEMGNSVKHDKFSTLYNNIIYLEYVEY